jgi:hypothetical protein
MNRRPIDRLRVSHRGYTACGITGEHGCPATPHAKQMTMAPRTIAQ